MLIKNTKMTAITESLLSVDPNFDRYNMHKTKNTLDTSDLLFADPQNVQQYQRFIHCELEINLKNLFHPKCSVKKRSRIIFQVPCTN